MTTSPPWAACSSRLDNWSFAARTFMTVVIGVSNTAASFSFAADRPLAGGYLNAFRFTWIMWPHGQTFLRSTSLRQVTTASHSVSPSLCKVHQRGCQAQGTWLEARDARPGRQRTGRKVFSPPDGSWHGCLRNSTRTCRVAAFTAW